MKLDHFSPLDQEVQCFLVLSSASAVCFSTCNFLSGPFGRGVALWGPESAFMLRSPKRPNLPVFSCLVSCHIATVPASSSLGGLSGRSLRRTLRVQVVARGRRRERSSRLLPPFLWALAPGVGFREPIKFINLSSVPIPHFSLYIFPSVPTADTSVSCRRGGLGIKLL